MRGSNRERLRVAVLVAGLFVALVPGIAIAAPLAGDVAALPADATSWIVTLKGGHNPDREAPGLAKGAGGKIGQTYRHALNGFSFKGSAKAAAALLHNPNVRTVVADGPVKMLADTIPTGISRIHANHATMPSAYGSGFTGAGIRVAILDTGIDLTHPDLVPNLDISLGKNCITAGPPQDGHGHGTHVAGIVAAADNGSGIVGVAPRARLVPIKVLDDTGQGEWSNLICAIDYLTALATDNDPTNDVRVANMSLGDVGSASNCIDGFVRQAICTSTAAGIVYVAAAGNSTVDTSTFIPAAYPEVVTVSALTDLDGLPGGRGGCWLFFFFCDDTLAEFSNYGSVVDVTAPGTQIYSSWTGGGYMTEMGTSMAAPHVAGAAALVLAQNPSLQPAEVEALLKTTGECANGQQADASGAPNCVGKGTWGNDPDGYGEPVVNALAAAEAAGGDSRPTIQITNPTNGSTVTGVVTITANATDDLGVVKVDFSVGGTHAATDTNGADGWSMLWDTTTIPGGVYVVTATATDTTGHTRTDSVTVRAGTNLQGDWVGAYGSDGYILAAWNGTTGDLSVLPAGVTYSVEQGSRHSWAAPTSDVRALESASQAERRATTWYYATQVRVRLNFAAAYTGTLHLYALDFDTTIRRETVTVDDGGGPRSLNLSTPFNSGAWLHFPVAVASGGSVVITATNNAGTSTNAVIAGVFLGGPGQPLQPPPPPPPPSADLPGLQGHWVGAYGNDGYVLGAWNGTSDLSVLPAGVTYAVEQASRHSWAAPTTDVRALESPSQSERRATTWYHATQVRVRLNFAAAYAGTLHLYALDFDTTARRETVTVNDGTGPRSLNLASAFNAGAWLHFPINVPAGGSVVITADNNAGASTNAVIGGVFLGGAGTAATAPGAPTDLGAVPGDGVVALLWSPPASDGGSPITGYTVTASPGGATCTASAITICAVGGLTNGIQYTFTVTATNAIGTGPASAPVTATPTAGATVPGAPTDLGATAGNGTVGLSWTPPASDGGSEIVGYQIYRGDATGNEVFLTSSDVATYADNAVVNGTTYWYQVSAVNTAGEGPRSSEQSATPSATLVVPGAPTGLGATRGNGQVGLNWTAPASDGGSPITGYTATASPGGATCATPGTTSCTVTGLANGTLYTFTVTATNSIGTGPASAPVMMTPATVPDPPTGLIATRGNGNVALAWTVSASDGGDPITGYTATASPGGATCSTTGAGCTIVSLANGTLYTFTVTASNGVGSSLPSASATATPATVPDAPTSLIATRGIAQVALTWSAPAFDGGSAVTGYTATASPGGATCSTVGATNCTVTGLANGTLYSFRVVASNAVGPSLPSVSTSATTAAVPDAPTSLAATPGNGQVALTWNAPATDGGSSITGYTATASPGGATCSTAGSTGCTIGSLTNGTLYTFTVQATNAVGDSAAAASTTATPGTVPDAPTGLVATRGNAQVALNWTAPASNGGSPITGYTATASPSGLTCSTPGTTNCTITGLTNGTAYSFTVTATNAIGTSAPSASAGATPATVPGAPTGLVATSGNAQVTLTWSAPASNGGSSITGYTATASPGGATCSTAGLGCTITGLTNGALYSFTVKATNAVGSGAASGAATATPSTIPSAPGSLTATPGNVTVSLTWTAPSNGGSPITAYKVYRSTSSGTETVIATLGNVLTYTDNAVVNGTTYFYQVTAVNSRGESARSTETSARPATVPGAPRNLSAKSRQAGGVSLGWNAPLSNGGAPVTAYRIYRSTSAGTEVFLVAVGNVTSFNDTIGTVRGVRYYYKVSAVNVMGEGVKSAESSAVAR